MGNEALVCRKQTFIHGHSSLYFVFVMSVLWQKNLKCHKTLLRQAKTVQAFLYRSTKNKFIYVWMFDGNYADFCSLELYMDIMKIIIMVNELIFLMQFRFKIKTCTVSICILKGQKWQVNMLSGKIFIRMVW